MNDNTIPLIEVSESVWAQLKANTAINIAVSAAVWAMRTRLRKSMRDLAIEASCSTSCISKVETGQRIPNVVLLRRLARACGLSLSDVGALIDDVAARELDTIAQGRLHAQLYLDEKRPRQASA